MPNPKALFSVAEVEVTIACPHCHQMQDSPSGRCGPQLWDRRDVSQIGLTGEITCAHCGTRFDLPMKLINLLAGL